MQNLSPQSTGSEGVADEWAEENRQLAELVALASHGSVAAFEALYDRTARWLLAEVRSVVRDGQAEDVLAETYLQVWRTLRTYDRDRASPGAWMRTIARSRALDHLRREKVHGNGHAHEDACAFAEQGNTRYNPEQLLSSAEESKLVRLMLSGPCLSTDERNVIGLAYFRDHTQQEIADLTGLPLGTVKTMMSRAQNKLRRELGVLLSRDRAARTMPPSA